MAERSTVTQVVQLGLEVTPGTSVAATKKLASVDVTSDLQFTIDAFRPAGFKYDTVTATEKEWVDLSFKGQPTYTEMIWLLASLIKVPSAPTTILNGASADTGGRRWTFEPSTSSPDTPQTFTIEQGSSVRAHKMTYGLITEMAMNFTRDKNEMSGKGIAQGITDGITLSSGGVTQLDLVPITSAQICVYIDSTSAALGTTKLGRLFMGNPSLGSRYNPVWAVDCSAPSFSTHVETPNTSGWKMMVEADAAGMAYLTGARSNTTYFLRILANGPVIYNAAAPYIATPLTYSFQWDMAVKISDVQPFSDHEGVYAVGFDFVTVHDATWGKAQHIEVVNTIQSMT